MPRPLRVEYEGAVYHVMCRGDGGEAILRSDRDREAFLDTLGEVCEQTGWIVHAYALIWNPGLGPIHGAAIRFICAADGRSGFGQSVCCLRLGLPTPRKAGLATKAISQAAQIVFRGIRAEQRQQKTGKKKLLGRILLYGYQKNQAENSFGPDPFSGVVNGWRADC